MATQTKQRSYEIVSLRQRNALLQARPASGSELLLVINIQLANYIIYILFAIGNQHENTHTANICSFN